MILRLAYMETQATQNSAPPLQFQLFDVSHGIDTMIHPTKQERKGRKMGTTTTEIYMVSKRHPRVSNRCGTGKAANRVGLRGVFSIGNRKPRL